MGREVRERDEMERQIAAGRDDEAVVLGIELANGVVLDAGGPDRVLARNSKRWSSFAFATRRRRFGETVKMRAEWTGMVVAWENSAVLVVMRTSFRADAGTWRESVCSTGARDASATVAQLSG